MTDRPAPVRIDDLRAPSFAPEVTRIRAAAAAGADPAGLAPEPIIAAAAAATGLDPAVAITTSVTTRPRTTSSCTP